MIWKVDVVVVEVVLEVCFLGIVLGCGGCEGIWSYRGCGVSWMVVRVFVVVVGVEGDDFCCGCGDGG